MNHLGQGHGPQARTQFILLNFQGGENNTGPTADSTIQLLSNHADNKAGDWIDFKGTDDWKFYDGTVQGIAEIELDPNNAPTGQPEIKGKLIVGNTLTADISNISDQDNFKVGTQLINIHGKSSIKHGQRLVTLIFIKSQRRIEVSR